MTIQQLLQTGHPLEAPVLRFHSLPLGWKNDQLPILGITPIRCKRVSLPVFRLEAAMRPESDEIDGPMMNSYGSLMPVHLHSFQ